jgi:hypothetical protein
MRITLTEFKKLLRDVKEQTLAIKVKTHTGWSKDFLHIVGFIAQTNEQSNNGFVGVVLSNEAETEGILINNVSTITAFELNEACGSCLSNTVYTLEDHVSPKAVSVENEL